MGKLARMESWIATWYALHLDVPKKQNCKFLTFSVKKKGKKGKKKFCCGKDTGRVQLMADHTTQK